MFRRKHCSCLITVWQCYFSWNYGSFILFMSLRSDVAQFLEGGIVKGKLLHLFILLLPLSHVYCFNLLLGWKLSEAEDYLLLYICTVREMKNSIPFGKLSKPLLASKHPTHSEIQFSFCTFPTQGRIQCQIRSLIKFSIFSSSYWAHLK